MSKDVRQGTSENLASQLMSEGHYDKAEPLLRVLLECRSNVFGGDHVDTASAYQMLGYVLDKQGKYEEAFLQYECSLKSYEHAYGLGHPNADMVYACITQLCRKTKQFDKALQKSMRLLEIRMEVLGDAHLKTARSCHNVAICLYDLGKGDEALGMLNRALKVQQNAGDSDIHGTSAMYTTMAKMLVKQKRFDKAMQIYEHVLTHQVPVLGQCSPAAALTFRNIGLAYEAQGDTLTAWNTCIKALETQVKLLQDSDPNAAWRSQCQKNTGSIDALNAEASTTLQIVQSLEKKLSVTMCTPQASMESGADFKLDSSTDPNGMLQQNLVKHLRQIEALQGKGKYNLTQEEMIKLKSKQEILDQLAALSLQGK
ncbi:MAG: hypothetical protein SGBAC_010634 [Bacillariaceae sp.]